MIELMKVKGFDYDIVPLYLKYGVFCKKELYEYEITLPNNIKTVVNRNRVVSKVCDNIFYSETMLEM